jgi:hypothetical protein
MPARYALGDSRRAGKRPHTPRGGVLGYFWEAVTSDGKASRGTLCYNAKDTRPRKERRAAARAWAKLERQAKRGKPAVTP